MNGKIKAVVIVALILIFVSSAIYVAPTLAYPNGTMDQMCNKDMNRIGGRDCVCDCDQDRNQIRTQLRECTQNQPSTGFTNWHHCCEHQHRYQNMLSP
ncbi:MAG: hypothetical protein H3Z50_03865 [archaeon]|nr:hypothetical protein [archaeon]MCP8306600.1 hypothetical protein [archaeon]